MRVMVFEGGEPGREERVPGEYPQAELSELLGGKAELRELSGKLLVAVREDGERERLSIRYALERPWRAAEPIAGPCAVVRRDGRGFLRDMRDADMALARELVKRTGV